MMHEDLHSTLHILTHKVYISLVKLRYKTSETFGQTQEQKSHGHAQEKIRDIWLILYTKSTSFGAGNGKEEAWYEA